MNEGFMCIKMLPALHGDCLILEYGDSKVTRRILVDGGPIGAFDAIEPRIKGQFELIVLTHVDGDHIEGLVRLFASPEPWPFQARDVWFNGWRHLRAAGDGNGLLGPQQGEYFSALLAARVGMDSWNSAFGGGPVVAPADGDLPHHELDKGGGMTITILSPTVQKLAKMRDAWREDIVEIQLGDLATAWALLAKEKRLLPAQGLLGGSDELQAITERQWRPDNTAANGASIAFLAEYGGKSCLFLADAHADVICESLKRLLKTRGVSRLRVDAVKVSHHGSAGNTNDELMELIESPRFLFSANGRFKHPHSETVRRIIVGSTYKRPTLFFNYLSAHNKQWQDAERRKDLQYRVRYNLNQNSPMVVRL